MFNRNPVFNLRPSRRDEGHVESELRQAETFLLGPIAHVMKGRHSSSLETVGRLGYPARGDGFDGFSLPVLEARANSASNARTGNTAKPPRSATLRIHSSGRRIRGERGNPRVQRQDVVAKFQRRGVYTSCDGRDYRLDYRLITGN